MFCSFKSVKLVKTDELAVASTDREFAFLIKYLNFVRFFNKNILILNYGLNTVSIGKTAADVARLCLLCLLSLQKLFFHVT